MKIYKIARKNYKQIKGMFQTNQRINLINISQESLLSQIINLGVNTSYGHFYNMNWKQQYNRIQETKICMQNSLNLIITKQL